MNVAAHISKDHRHQTLVEHLIQVSRRTRDHAAKLRLGPAGELIGLLHDLGKATELFQTYLFSFGPESAVEPQDELRGKIDHSTAGAQVLWREFGGDGATQQTKELVHLLALSIVSHHSGLIDCVSPDGEDRLSNRLLKSPARTRVDEAWHTVDAAVRTRAAELLSDPALLNGLRRACRRALHGEGNAEAIDRHHLQLGLLIRMLFSCLIDADRTDTAGFEHQAAGSMRQDGAYVPWTVLLERLEVELGGMPVDGEVNRIRRDVSAACAGAAARPGGAYRLTVPTGGGKTLAALRFALEHARRGADRQAPIDRIVFVSPYISIVEQNAAVARRVLERDEPFASVVLEHHSNLSENESKGNREHWRRKLLAENWDAPVVFTTMAQVLEALFGGGTRAVRRLHALARAVIVFDEAQTLPVRVLHLFNNAVNYLVRECGSTVLLCTATQPRLDDVNAEHGALRLAPEAEVIADVTALFRSLQRYTVEDASAKIGGWSQADVAETACRYAREHDSCLAVLNTKRDVREVFNLCREQLPEGIVVHLSTGMCPAHRAEKLEELKRQLAAQVERKESTPPIVCVSTNLIEAGVDIDFATVVRDLAGLDSIAQAAGRCNRHGFRRGGGHVLIVRLPDPPKQSVDVLHGRAASARILDEWRREHAGEPFPLDSPEPMQRFFAIVNHERREEMMFSVRGRHAEREDTLLCMLGTNAKAVDDAKQEGKPIQRRFLHQSFATAGECFQLIAPTQGVVVPFREDGEKIVNDLCASHDLAAEWQLLRQAQRYTISLYDHAFRRLLDERAVYEVKKDSGVFALRPEWYEKDFGLRAEGGPLEALIG